MKKPIIIDCGSSIPMHEEEFAPAHDFSRHYKTEGPCESDAEMYPDEFPPECDKFP